MTTQIDTYYDDAPEQRPRRSRVLVPGLVALALIAVCGATVFHWTVNRVYVPVGKSLLLRYKGPLVLPAKVATPGFWAEEGEVGVRRELRGPGRHFYCPLWYETKLIDDVEILPGEVGVVTCKVGESLPDGEFLVDGEVGETRHKGILRQPLGPGRYRINPYGYKVDVIETLEASGGGQRKVSGWVNIPSGYVGVVTNLAANAATGRAAGIQREVFPPGIYLVNPHEQQVDVVEIGYRESTVVVDKKRQPDGGLQVDESGEPIIADAGSGISFPSSDGFSIHMDFTAIWGVMPDQAPHAIQTFGNISQVENKVVRPQIESICRNNGSKFTAVKLLVGEDRERFQHSNREELHKVLLDKKITLLYGLVRHIYIPKEIREPKQTAFIADELRLTREQEQLTAHMEAELREAERKVELETERVNSDTEKQVASKLAEGRKSVGEIEAETRKLVANIAKETAGLEAQATLVLGEAENQGKQMIEEATADRFRLAVEAFGSAKAYNDWVFAENLPHDLDLNLIYAGDGTLWTDASSLGVRANVPIKQKAK